MKESSIEGMAKDAYLYELNDDFVMASAYYKKLGYLDRLKKVEEKLKWARFYSCSFFFPSLNFFSAFVKGTGSYPHLKNGLHFNNLFVVKKEAFTKLNFW